MKLILKIAWLTNSDPHMRNGYVHLSQFQDGVGGTAIDPTLPAATDPREAVVVLEPYLAIADKVGRELALLLAKFADFKPRGAFQ